MLSHNEFGLKLFEPSLDAATTLTQSLERHALFAVARNEILDRTGGSAITVHAKTTSDLFRAAPHLDPSPVLVRCHTTSTIRLLRTSFCGLAAQNSSISGYTGQSYRSHLRSLKQCSRYHNLEHTSRSRFVTCPRTRTPSMHYCGSYIRWKSKVFTENNQLTK